MKPKFLLLSKLVMQVTFLGLPTKSAETMEYLSPTSYNTSIPTAVTPPQTVRIHSSPSRKPTPAPIVTISCTERHFFDILDSDIFVDKTRLLEEFVNGGIACGKKLVTAPSGFGKTTNLRMILNFFELPISSETGKLVPEKETMVFNEFFNLHELAISNASRPDFVHDHFMSYGILFLDFSTGHSSTESAEDTIKKTICKAIERYAVAFRHNQLGKKLLTEIGNKDISFIDICMAITKFLNVLSVMYPHKGTMLIVDDYDYLIRIAMKNGDDALDVRESIEVILSDAIMCERCVTYAFVAGISNMIPREFSSGVGVGQDLSYSTFLNYHRYVPYFGFTKNEVNEIFKRFSIDEKKAEEVLKFYGGYMSRRGIKVYPINFIRHYLENRTNQDKLNFTFLTPDIFHLRRLNFFLSNHEIIYDLLSLLLHRNISVDIYPLVDLKEIDYYSKSHKKDETWYQIAYVHLGTSYQSHLFEVGLLTYVNPNNNELVSIPNTECQKVIIRLLDEYEDDNKNSLNLARRTARDLFTKIIEQQRRDKETLLELKEALNATFFYEIYQNDIHRYSYCQLELAIILRPTTKLPERSLHTNATATRYQYADIVVVDHAISSTMIIKMRIYDTSEQDKTNTENQPGDDTYFEGHAEFRKRRLEKMLIHVYLKEQNMLITLLPTQHLINDTYCFNSTNVDRDTISV